MSSTLPAPHRFSREEYDQLVATGVFEGKRLELLEGEIIEMSPQKPPHASAVARLNEILVSRLSGRFSIRPQLPTALDDWSEPEPDLVVCRARPDHYAGSHPSPHDVLLAIEVSDSSLSYDRGRKAAAYAAAGIAAFWIVDLNARSVIVLEEPDAGRRAYRRERRAGPAEPLALPGGDTVTPSEFLPT
jgi:Uma2 family endonuclease